MVATVVVGVGGGAFLVYRHCQLGVGGGAFLLYRHCQLGVGGGAFLLYGLGGFPTVGPPLGAIIPLIK